ncbi:MAG: ABC transporter ATP-binding protein [Deltaproteobacteria bacterium]|nr:ABC transporter ATP-binding protein [Nannocystaceae bacterium]
MGSIAPLELRGLGKRFGRLAVLRGIDLRVVPGEIVGLLGANGCGKTTLLSIAAGLLPPSVGERCYGPAAVAELDLAARMKLAYVAHATQLYGRLSARENLELPASLRAVAGEREHVAPDELLERVGLAHAATRMAGTFSRGMQQRLAIARALLGRPELLLLDEPFTALDHAGRQTLGRVLVQERDRGAAILLSSHDLDAVAEFSDRAVAMGDGRIVGEARRDDDAGGPDYGARIRRLGVGPEQRLADAVGEGGVIQPWT